MFSLVLFFVVVITGVNLLPIIKEPKRILQFSCPFDYTYCVEKVVWRHGMGFYSILHRQFKGREILFPKNTISTEHIQLLAKMIPIVDNTYNPALSKNEFDQIKNYSFIKTTYIAKTYIPNIYPKVVVGNNVAAFIWDAENNGGVFDQEIRFNVQSFGKKIYIIPNGLIKTIREKN